MLTKFSIALASFAASVMATPGAANGYARGVPPTTSNCNTYAKSAGGLDDQAQQYVAWGLKVDREFGGCQCADEQEQIFTINPFKNAANMWHCRCTNPDLYLSMPNARIDGAGNIDDTNGKLCGIDRECMQAAITQQQIQWNQEAARALQTKNNARTYAKRQYSPIDNEYRRSRVIRNQNTMENRLRARVQVGALSGRYRAIKNSFMSGSLSKSSFERAYSSTAANLSSYRQQWSSRQTDINDQWGMILAGQSMTQGLMSNELQQAESMYEQTMASIADRYGKRIAYYQSLPIIVNQERKALNQWTNTRVCPVYQDGQAQPTFPQLDY